MEFVLIGPGQLGQLLLRQAGRDCLVIGQDADSTRQVGELYGCPWTTKIERAAEGEVIAVVVPASAVPSVLEQVASCAKPGAVVLNFATAVDIPRALREKRPDLVWSEAKLVGSAVGMAHGLPCMIRLCCGGCRTACPALPIRSLWATRHWCRRSTGQRPRPRCAP